jgi:hypothetical protein
MTALLIVLGWLILAVFVHEIVDLLTLSDRAPTENPAAAEERARAIEAIARSFF